MLNKMKFHKPLLIIMLVVLSVTLFPSTTFAEESNKAEVRAGLAQGGWYVVYGDLINEADYAAFLAAVGTLR